MTFARSLELAVIDRKDIASRVIKGTLFSITGNIIKRTPVGNSSLWKGKAPAGYVGGTLRGAWAASIGAPVLKSAISVKPDKNGVATQKAVKVIIDSLELGEIFYMTNNMAYAHRVEFGWSTQAPAGMLRVSVSEANQAIKKQ